MSSTHSDLVVQTPEGLYCPTGRFHIDPWRPVPCAVITHAHADHARIGAGCYHVVADGLELLRWRLGEQSYVVHEAGHPFRLGRAAVSLHPAGHVLGSSQVRIEADGVVWVVSGDFKRQPDPTCAPFELVPCDVFVTECTFGLPVYRWPDTATVAADIAAWRAECAANGEAALLYAYALGKSQRLLAELAPHLDGPVWVHGAVEQGVQAYRRAGVRLPPTCHVSEAPRADGLAGQLVLAPPSAAGSAWARRFRRAQQGFASGWMQIRGNRRRANHDRGFVVSDHADWPALLQTIAQTGARRVIATHGDTDALVRVLRESGVQADVFHTEFGDEEPAVAEPAA